MVFTFFQRGQTISENLIKKNHIKLSQMLIVIFLTVKVQNAHGKKCFIKK